MVYDWKHLPSKHPRKKFPKVKKLSRMMATQPDHQPHGFPEEKRPEKFRNIKTTVDGIKFASKKEARRYQELLMAEKACLILNLKIHPVFYINLDNWVNPHGQIFGHCHICDYIADFSYTDCERGGFVVEDVKGKDKKTGWDTRTKEYKLKKILMRVIMGIEVREV